MTYSVNCPLCGKEIIIEGLNEYEIENIARYKVGEISLYDVFEEENNTPSNRELIKSGICNDCWEAMFDLDEEDGEQGHESEDKDGD